MSYGEGNLHERVDELERENAGQRERIEELESLLYGFHHCAKQGKCANCEHFAGNDGCSLGIWERYDALGIETEGGA